MIIGSPAGWTHSVVRCKDLENKALREACNNESAIALRIVLAGEKGEPLREAPIEMVFFPDRERTLISFFGDAIEVSTAATTIEVAIDEALSAAAAARQ
ncbi:MAG TPA: hypothetical protein VGP72_05155 [Planctomycetota bacterium]|jgi:hypothetical protein